MRVLGSRVLGFSALAWRALVLNFLHVNRVERKFRDLGLDLRSQIGRALGAECLVDCRLRRRALLSS